MPGKGIPVSQLGKSTVANPRDFLNGVGVARFSPQPRSGGGPAVRKAGHRVGMVDESSVARMNPTPRVGGGPATRKPGHRVGQVNDINPQPRFHPLG